MLCRSQSVIALCWMAGKPQHGNQVGDKRPYPANLCSLSCGVELADFGEDLGHPIGEPIETMSGRAVR